MTVEMTDGSASERWKTKPDDRFILRWIKLHLSAPITVRLLTIGRLRPGMITISSALFGMAGLADTDYRQGDDQAAQ